MLGTIPQIVLTFDTTGYHCGRHGGGGRTGFMLTSTAPCYSGPGGPLRMVRISFFEDAEGMRGNVCNSL